MRVLLMPYPGTWRIEGGHRTQQAETARALCRAGADAIVGELGSVNPSEFDVVHFFGDPRPLLRAGRPRSRLVVSPVHFPAAIELGQLPWRGGRGAVLGTRLRHAARCGRHPLRRRLRKANFRARLQAVARADLIVTNSRAEAQLLAADARRPLPPVRIAHSGVDAGFFSGEAAVGRRLVGVERFVLCVGRVEPIKNQLSLALAMRAFPELRLVLVGSVLPGNEAYLEACRRAAPSLVHVPQVERAELRHVYAAAAAHVLPSWFETTGLATMEAAAAGTPVVVGRSPCVEDYFGECAQLADPGNIDDLRAAIARALDGPRDGARQVAARFSWDRTARELIDAYES